MTIVNPFGDMTFGEWLQTTKVEEEIAFGLDFLNFEGERLMNWYCQMSHGISSEAIEFSDEFGYKEWDSKAPWVNRSAAISEASDLLHFLGLMLAQIQCTGQELSDAYMKTVAKNYARQAQAGKDDVQARRCTGCGRSLDDAGFDLRYNQETYGHDARICRACHTVNPIKENS